MSKFRRIKVCCAAGIMSICGMGCNSMMLQEDVQKAIEDGVEGTIEDVVTVVVESFVDSLLGRTEE